MSDATPPTSDPSVDAATRVAALTPPTVADPTARIAALELQLSEQAGKFAEQVALTSSLTTERDALAARAALVESLTTERDTAVVAFQKLTDKTREVALLDKLYAALPHAPRTDVQRTVRALAAEGKATLAPESPDAAAEAILGALKAEQSALLRAPVGASGGTNPPNQTTAQIDPLMALFGPRRTK